MACMDVRVICINEMQMICLFLLLSVASFFVGRSFIEKFSPAEMKK